MVNRQTGSNPDFGCLLRLAFGFPFQIACGLRSLIFNQKARGNLMTLLRYDPERHIDANAWLALDESERTRLIVRYHRREHILLPNETAHAAIHVIVENQVALGEAFPVEGVLLRLMHEGLDRHEAVHAIGSVLSETFFSAMSAENVNVDLNAEYVEKLRKLSAESWRKLAL